MNVQTYIQQLGNVLQEDCGTPPDANLLGQYMVGAVRAYSTFRALKRNVGEGGLAKDSKVDETSITVVGGPYIVGATIILDAYTPWAETAVISDVARSPLTLSVGVPIQITLTAPLAKVHYAGAIVANQFLGLNLVVGQAEYMMPTDFIEPEQESWGFAVGERYTTKRTETFYDGVYRFSSPISGVDLGYAQNFLGGYPGIAGSFPGLPGVPANQVNLPNGPTSYEFNNSAIVILTFNPVPAQVRTLNFYYWASHLPETVPDVDFQGLLEYGKYLGLSAAQAQAARKINFTQGSVKEDWSNTSKALKDAAANALDQFNKLIAFRPIAVTG